MKPYRSKSGKSSGVEAFSIGEDYIVVKFKHADKSYRYSYSSAGKDAVEEMKLLASAQEGLSTYISRNNPPYE